MTPKEIATYLRFIMREPGYTCFLCRQAIGVGERGFWVPETCDDTEKCNNGQPYDAKPAHKKCIELVP